MLQNNLCQSSIGRYRYLSGAELRQQVHVIAVVPPSNHMQGYMPNGGARHDIDAGCVGTGRDSLVRGREVGEGRLAGDN